MEHVLVKMDWLGHQSIGTEMMMLCYSYCRSGLTRFIPLLIEVCKSIQRQGSQTKSRMSAAAP